MSAVTGEGKAYTTDGLNSDRVHGTERHLLSLQYSDADFYGQNLVSQIYYRDESLTFTLPDAHQRSGQQLLLI